MFVTNDVKWLMVASDIARIFSGCTKVAVGSVIVKNGNLISAGANRTDLDLCKSKRGCLRIEKYGDNAKIHRNPDDCRAIHSEIDAISRARQNLEGTTIYVTRYPCEACARAIIASGIDRVVYGRETPVSEMTYRLFEYHHIEIAHISEYKEDDNDK